GVIGVDQADGELYVYDLGHGVIDQFTLDGEGGAECPQYSYARQMPPPGSDKNPLLSPRRVNIAVDGPCRTGTELSESCNLGEYKSPNEGEVYITVGHNASDSHLYAFKPRVGGPPEVLGQRASEITETEAVLGAEINPGALQTNYYFEYTTQADFEEHGYANAIRVPDPAASAGNGGAFVSVPVPVTGLEPGVTYRFRLVASNCEDEEADPELCLTVGEGVQGGQGSDASFSTYPASASVSGCPNEAMRTGRSNALPDCRAYELITPPDTGGHSPTMSMVGDELSYSGFPTTMVSPDGESVVFGSRSGALPGLGGGGFQDTYTARRDEASGWQSRFTGLSNIQAEKPRLGAISPDHGYAFWYVFPGDRGILVDGGGGARYLRLPPGTQSTPSCTVPDEPEGRLEWIACGDLGFHRGSNPTRGLWISPGADHVIFETEERLQNCAPPTGTNAIYDRRPGGDTRCVSLLPGEQTPEAGATYRGTSADGSAVAFTINGVLYVRLGDAETVEVADGNPIFGGIAGDGSRVFYVKDGDAFAFDTASQVATKVGSGGETTLAYVSADGSHAFFVSPKQLDGTQGEAGKDNLYAWDGSATHFVAVLDPLDLSGEGVFGQGLGRWLSHALASFPDPAFGPARVSARATPDGSVFVFESQAALAGHEGNGQRQIYRYEEGAPAGERLRCLSCNPTGTPAGSAAQLESLPATDAFISLPPVNSLTQIANVTADGEKVFFQSAERLVSADIDGRQDVYEWQAQGSPGCDREAGCLGLISSGRSAGDDYLYAMTPDGSDVLFLSGDTLVPQDPDGLASIYDAREGGGFPPPPTLRPSCLGDACQPNAISPDDVMPATSTEKPANPRRKGNRTCSKGKRKVHRAGKARCTRRHGKRAQRHKHRRHSSREALR
ncbi:MAG TPA: hypothetical protein VN752_01270, partial [Solirubrobacterales bacterium]|nr:hypothetical protein [Solirubrobacterales bacterium]